MTKRKEAVARQFRPERASRETMAYLLDMSTDTFDRLVAAGHLPPAKIIAGIRRWHVDAVFAKWDGLDVSGAAGTHRVPEPANDETDLYMPPKGARIGKAQGRRGTA